MDGLLLLDEGSAASVAKRTEARLPSGCVQDGNVGLSYVLLQQEPGAVAVLPLWILNEFSVGRT